MVAVLVTITQGLWDVAVPVSVISTDAPAVVGAGQVTVTVVESAEQEVQTD